MTQDEFLYALSEDKFFENPEEMIKYRLPVVQHYLTNYINISIMTEQGGFNLNQITIERNHTDREFQLINYAFNAIKDLVLKSKKTIFAG